MGIRKSYFITYLLVFSGIYSSSFAQINSTKLNMLSKGADVILTGKVIEQNSKWNEDRSRIYTDATIQVEEYLKGNTNESKVVVNYLGGEVGDVGELYTHMPNFEDDEEVLVFLNKDQNNSSYKVFHGEEGKLSIVYDETTGEKITTSSVKINSLKTQIKNFTNKN